MAPAWQATLVKNDIQLALANPLEQAIAHIDQDLPLPLTISQALIRL